MDELERLDDGTIVFAGHRAVVPNPSLPVELVLLEEYQRRVRRERENRVLYARWLERRRAQAEQDRRTRWFLVGAGIAFVLGTIGLAALAVWWVASAVTSLGAALLVIPGGALALALLGTIGHHCVITVTHRH